MTRNLIAVPLIAALALAAAAIALVPRGFDAGWLLYAQDDPVLLADRAVAMSFSASAAQREIESALAANDADLAASFLDLSRDRGVRVDASLAERVAVANSTSANVSRGAEGFARGLITGEPDDMVGLAGTAFGDLFVFGDIRDAIREGVHCGSFANGASAVGVILDNSAALSTAGSKLVSVRNATTEKYAIDCDGIPHPDDALGRRGRGGYLGTVNKPAGTFTLSSGNSVYTLTNSLITSGVQVFVQISSAHRQLLDQVRRREHGAHTATVGKHWARLAPTPSSPSISSSSRKRQGTPTT